MNTLPTVQKRVSTKKKMNRPTGKETEEAWNPVCDYDYDDDEEDDAK